MMRISPIAILLIVLVVSLLPVSVCFRGSHDLKNSSHTEFQTSEAAEWIALPDDAHDITTYSYFGFDTNYRFLKATLAEAPPALIDLLDRSIQLQPRDVNETFVTIDEASIDFEGFDSAFQFSSSVMPAWWKTDFSRFDHQSYCTWEADDYGYGYVYLYDSQQKELRAFQWSQQWNTVDRTRTALGD